MADNIPTKLANLINPAVYDQMITASIKKAIRFTPLATIDNTLEGQAGDTKHFPKYNNMGDAVDVAEGEEIPDDVLTTTDASVTVKSIGKSFSITDQAVESGLGDSIAEGTKQLANRIAQKVDSDLIEASREATQTVAFAATVDGVQAAVDTFNDEDDAEIVGIFNPSDASAIVADARKQMIGSDVGANALIAGTKNEILGVQIVRTNKVSKGEAFYVKPGALRLVNKKGATTETERIPGKRTTKIYAYQDYAPYLFDDSLLVYAKSGAASTDEGAGTGSGE